jgi:hypothetical protein
MLVAISQLTDGKCSLVKGACLPMLRGFIVSVSDGVEEFAQCDVVWAEQALSDLQSPRIKLAGFGVIARRFRVLNVTPKRFREIFECCRYINVTRPKVALLNQ